MKKLLVVIFVLFPVSLCFAAGQRNSLDLGAGWHRMQQSHEGDAVTIPSFAVNFAGTTFFTDTIGIGAYGNFLFPREARISVMGYSMTLNRSAFDTLTGFDLLAGPVFMLFNNGTFSLPLAAGVYWSHLGSSASVSLLGFNASASARSNQVGLGANLSGEYHLSQNIYLFGRFHFAVGLYGWGTTSGTSPLGTVTFSESGFTSTITAAPSAGIGFRW